MNCQELRSLFEEQPNLHATTCPESAGIAEHLANCFACAEWVQSRDELGAGFRMMREAAPEFPASLDRAVLANYRQHAHAATRSSERIRHGRKFSPLTALAWSAALVLAILVAGAELGLVLPRNEGGVWTDQKRAPAQITTTAPPAGLATESTAHTANSNMRKAWNKPHIAQKVHPQNDEAAARTTASLSEEAEQLPDAFTGLMYCDALSCGGDMQVIRLQLPLQQVLPAATTGAKRLVSADVLVGPDGIARGIRIVE